MRSREIPIRQRRDRGRKRIEKQFIEIDAMSFAWLVRTVDAIRVELTGTNPFYPNMPHVARAIACGIEIDDLARLCIRGMLKQLQANASGIAAEESEVHSVAGLSCPQWQPIPQARLSTLWRAICSLAAATTCAGSNPKCRATTFIGADSPNVCKPMMVPPEPA